MLERRYVVKQQQGGLLGLSGRSLTAAHSFFGQSFTFISVVFAVILTVRTSNELSDALSLILLDCVIGQKKQCLLG